MNHENASEFNLEQPELKDGMRLPEGQFAVYEVGEKELCLRSIQRANYTPIDPTTQRRTILSPGDEMVSKVYRILPFVQMKKVVVKNVDGQLNYNGHRIPLKIAEIFYSLFSAK